MDQKTWRPLREVSPFSLPARPKALQFERRVRNAPGACSYLRGGYLLGSEQLGNVRRTWLWGSVRGPFLASLFALTSTLAMLAAAPSAQAATVTVPAPDLPAALSDQDEVRAARASSSGAAPATARAGCRISTNESCVQRGADAAGAAWPGMPEAAARVTDGRGWPVSKQSNALARLAGGMTVAAGSRL
jgi:hypothetical protein